MSPYLNAARGLQREAVRNERNRFAARGARTYVRTEARERGRERGREREREREREGGGPEILLDSRVLRARAIGRSPGDSAFARPSERLLHARPGQGSRAKVMWVPIPPHMTKQARACYAESPCARPRGGGAAAPEYRQRAEKGTQTSEWDGVGAARDRPPGGLPAPAFSTISLTNTLVGPRPRHDTPSLSPLQTLPLRLFLTNARESAPVGPRSSIFPRYFGL